ncbi:hypothetical protein MNV49_002936 [Pseudohyphozyma bogoriensis]|nr:hypothetical protein MNV49_002936 [Pseudohyphozyma bogoriensis]
MAPSIPGLPITPSSVKLSEEERKAGKWSRANIQRAVELMHRDGLLVIENIIDKEDLIKLRDDMLVTAREVKAAKTEATDYNHGIMSTDFLQAPPLQKQALRFPSVYQNPFCVQIAEAYLGPDLQMPFITANVAIAHTTERQPVHKDASFIHPTAPFMGIFNFLLSDFTPENGSTEFWLGSAQSTLPVEQMWRSKESKAPTCDVRPELLDERRKTREPSQVTVPFGSVLFRDVRTWHAGMPNPSDEDRIMVAVAYQSSWFPRDNRFLVPESSRELFTSNPKVNVLCKYVPDNEWVKVSQLWGRDEPMELIYRPNPDGWVTIGEVEPESKAIDLDFNPAAHG